MVGGNRWEIFMLDNPTPDESTRCFGGVNGHELLKRSRGGSITDMENVTLLCDFHNSFVEMHPSVSHEMGLAKHSWEVSSSSHNTQGEK
jgi:hypothetical protein